MFREIQALLITSFQVFERSSACDNWSKCSALNKCLSLLEVLFEASALQLNFFHGFEVGRWRMTTMQSTFHSFAPCCTLILCLPGSATAF